MATTTEEEEETKRCVCIVWKKMAAADKGEKRRRVRRRWFFVVFFWANSVKPQFVSFLLRFGPIIKEMDLLKKWMENVRGTKRRLWPILNVFFFFCQK